MIINRKLLKNNKKTLGKKIELFEKAFSGLEFDSFGRAKIGTMVNPINVEPLLEQLDDYEYDEKYFSSNFKKYCIEKSYEGVYHNIDSTDPISVSNIDKYYPSTIIGISCMVENIIRFRKLNGKIVRVKLTRVLSEVYKNFDNDYPEYKKTKDKLKEARKNNDLEEIAFLQPIKNNMEKGVFIFEYDKFLNANALLDDLYISVNPLDILTSSGTDADWNYANYPPHSTFKTCYSTLIGKTDKRVRVYSDGCYSDPYHLYKLGRINNRAIIYSHNSNIINIPFDDFNFIGYKLRINCWINKAEDNTYRLFLEKSYPTQTLKNAIETTLKNKGIILQDNIESITAFHSDLQIKNDNIAVSESNVYLDKVGINDDGVLCMLPKPRIEEKYVDNIGVELKQSYICKCGKLDYEEAMYHVDGTYICYDCFCRDYVTCMECDDYHLKEATVKTMGHGYICKQCIETLNIPICEVCNKAHSSSYTYEHENYKHLCRNCHRDIVDGERTITSTSEGIVGLYSMDKSRGHALNFASFFTQDIF